MSYIKHKIKGMLIYEIRKSQLKAGLLQTRGFKSVFIGTVDGGTASKNTDMDQMVPE